jgi:hypothetical protein
MDFLERMEANDITIIAKVIIIKAVVNINKIIYPEVIQTFWLEVRYTCILDKLAASSVNWDIEEESNYINKMSVSGCSFKTEVMARRKVVLGMADQAY